MPLPVRIASLGLVLLKGASVSIVLIPRSDDRVREMFVPGLGAFFNDLMMPPAWAGCVGVGAWTAR